MQTRMNSPERAVRTTMFGRWVLILLLAVAVGLPAGGLAQDDVNLPAEPAGAPSEVKAVTGPTVPYVAEMTGNDVRIRSGPGTDFYQCGRLYKGDRVQVVEAEHGWSCIVPPPGCFSWISMQYVSINLANPTMGIVTGDGVGTYAGSDYVKPMHSTSKQVTLGRGDRVKLLGEEMDDYYKIAPAEGAYLWVSSQYVRPIQTVPGLPPVDIEATAGRPSERPRADVNAATESDLLDTYYALSKLVKTERGKPIAEQDYGEIKTKLQELAKNETAGKAARYAEFTVKQVERFELARTVAEEMQLQSKELETVSEKIDEARAARLAQIKDLGRFAVVGQLESSSIYGGTGQTKRYRVLDASGKTICYVAPIGAAVDADFSKSMGKKVGVVGQIVSSGTAAMALVKFTEIIPLD